MLSEPFHVADREVRLSASIGVNWPDISVPSGLEVTAPGLAETIGKFQNMSLRDLADGLAQRTAQLVEVNLAVLGPRLEQQKQELGRRAAALYRLGGLSYLRVALSLEERKTLFAEAQRILGELRGSGALADAHDSSTAALIRRYVGLRRRT